MTPLGNLLPWFIAKRFLKVLAATTLFEIGGQKLAGISATNAFYIVDLPTRSRGLKRISEYMTYLLPTFLVLRHRQIYDFTVPALRPFQPNQTYPVWQIDPSTVIVECWNPAKVKEYEREESNRRVAAKAEDAIEASAARVLRESRKQEEKGREAQRKLVAVQAAQELNKRVDLDVPDLGGPA